MSLSLSSPSRARGIPPGLYELHPHLQPSHPIPRGLRLALCQKPTPDPPLPSSWLGSGTGSAGPEMSLSPVGREGGLLSSCPTLAEAKVGL